MTRGSTWRIWDFHVHTPFSSLNNQFGDPTKGETWETYIDRLESEALSRGVGAVGVTDYFTIEGYKKIRQYTEVGRLEGLLLFPNIEFRIDKVIYRRKDGSDPRRLNVHVLFSPELTPTEIEEGFLHNLDFVYENDPFEGAQTRKLKVGNLEEFGKLLQSQHTSFANSGMSAFEIGCMTAVVRSEEIQKLLHNNFRGKYLIVLAEEDLSLMDWDSQDHGVRKHLIQMAHAIFSANPKTRDFCVGHLHGSPQEYEAEFKSFKPCIWGCDTHEIHERFLEPDHKHYCWIKADVTWEGLKQILYEPEERVRIQEKNPEYEKSIFTIDNISIDATQVSTQLSFREFQAKLNPNLVTIIGGRGSGKTALLDVIASCFREGGKLSQLPNSFYSRVYELDKADPALQSIPVSLRFQSGDSFSKEIGADTSVFDKSDILYLTQNHFDEYSANPEKLHGHIIELVFAKFHDEKRRYDLLEGQERESQKRIQTINLEISQLEMEVAEQKTQAEESLKFKHGEYEDFNARITDIESRPEHGTDVIRPLTEKLASLKNRQRAIESLLYRLSELKNKIQAFRERYVEIQQTLNREMQEVLVGDSPVRLPDRIPQLEEIEIALDTNEDKLARRRKGDSEETGGIEAQLKELEGVSKTVAELRQRRDAITLEIQEVDTRLAEIRQKLARIGELDKERSDMFGQMMRIALSRRQFLQRIIETFEKDKSTILKNLEFRATVHARRWDEYVRSIAERTDNRVHSETDIGQQLSPALQQVQDVINGSKSDQALDNAVQTIKSVAERLPLKRRSSRSDFYNVVFSSFLGVSINIQFNSKHLGELSMGERAVVLLKIVLALDDRPLLIDQPEEHLDNRYIFNELTPAFRQAKTNRQIVIATHNANLVVNTDAEQVIVAEHLDGAITYTAGTLEDPAIRERVKSVLEGGDEAFRKREEKYGYRF